MRAEHEAAADAGPATSRPRPRSTRTSPSPPSSPGHPPLRRERAPGGGALRAAPDGAGIAQASSCTARRCRTTTTSTPTPPSVPPTTSTEPAVAIIKHANPCGIAVAPADAADPIAAAHPSRPRLRPASRRYGGVIAANRPVTAGDGRDREGHLHRGRRRPRLRPRGARDAAAKKNIRLLALPGRLRPRRPRGQADLGRPARAGRSTASTAFDQAPGPSSRASEADDADARRPRVRLAGVPLGEVERDPAGRRRAPPSASAWARSTGSTRATSP